MKQLKFLYLPEQYESLCEQAAKQEMDYPTLILDEIGYLPLNREDAALIFHLIRHRYEKASLILTSNKSFLDWGEVFGDQVVVTAILDRLLHHPPLSTSKAKVTVSKKSARPVYLNSPLDRKRRNKTTLL